MQGIVYLVGAGPGDLGLMTRRAYELVQQADCLIYDHLIDKKILEETKPTCEQIYVGKMMRNHTMKQEDINELLVDKAKEYECVVRLKGGDVYVFGRGGEEGIHLREKGISFQVVPGVSSCIGGLAYAGIPITHRGIATGFHVVTAHNQQDRMADIDFESMARGTDTCVFLMGLTKVKMIAEKLMDAGMAPESKIAVISKATLPEQEVVVSTLAEIEDKIEKHPLESPAMIVVGEVVGLREQLNFFEERPMYHQRILVPKVGSEPSQLGRKLRALGANITELQVGELIENVEALVRLDYDQYTHIVLSSRGAVRLFMKGLQRNKVDIRTLSHIRFAVVGESTEKELWNYGIKADIIPEIYESANLITQLKEEVEKSQNPLHILVPKVAGNHDEWEKIKSICKVDIVELYENRIVEMEKLLKVLESDWDMVIFTCGSAVERAFAMGKVKTKKILSIGNKTSETVARYIEKTEKNKCYQSKQATYDSLVELVVELQED